MSLERKKLGNFGEDLALEFLLKKKYKLIKRNLRLKVGEIDLLMQDKETLVIVEVKTKTDKRYGLPQEEVDYHKQRKLRQLAGALTQLFPEAKIRIDVVAIEESINLVEHIINAVESV